MLSSSSTYQNKDHINPLRLKHLLGLPKLVDYNDNESCSSKTFYNTKYIFSHSSSSSCVSVHWEVQCQKLQMFIRNAIMRNDVLWYSAIYLCPNSLTLGFHTMSFMRFETLNWGSYWGWNVFLGLHTIRVLWGLRHLTEDPAEGEMSLLFINTFLLVVTLAIPFCKHVKR